MVAGRPASPLFHHTIFNPIKTIEKKQEDKKGEIYVTYYDSPYQYYCEAQENEQFKRLREKMGLLREAGWNLGKSQHIGGPNWRRIITGSELEESIFTIIFQGFKSGKKDDEILGDLKKLEGWDKFIQDEREHEQRRCPSPF